MGVPSVPGAATQVSSEVPLQARDDGGIDEAPSRARQPVLRSSARAGGANTISAMQNALPVDILQPSDISDTVAFLVSDQARYITGVMLPVDAGFCNK